MRDAGTNCPRHSDRPCSSSWRIRNLPGLGAEKETLLLWRTLDFTSYLKALLSKLVGSSGFVVVEDDEW